LSKRLFQFGRHSGIFDRHETRQKLQDSYVAAKTTEDRGELDADRAASEDHDRSRNFGQMNRFVARQDPLAIDCDSRAAAWRGACRDDDLLAGAESLLVPLEYVDAAVPGQSRGAFDPVN